MKKFFLISLAATIALAPQVSLGQQPSAQEVARWEARALDITIIRDDWGIAHVYGKTDADAVFGIMYAQAEDDFNRVEVNYLNSIGRMAEAEGESAIYTDLRQQLFIDHEEMKRMYVRSPAWLRRLMDAFADGLNFYLYKHPEVEPRAITRFEPWMALTFTEGSIGGDIERVSTRGLEAFYGNPPMPVEEARGAGPLEIRSAVSGEPLSGAPVQVPLVDPLTEPAGSNGIAIAPANTRDGHALLLINPHTSFFFRAEVQMVSEEGLNAYGAITWGQFFVYQGFNEKAGWMHTSSGVDNIDEFLETVSEREGRYYYLYGGHEYPMRTRTITLSYRTDSGMARRQFNVYYTPHGPIVRSEGDRWVSVSLMNDPINALIQSYIRTKAHGLASYLESMGRHTNSSNNTLFADADGNIAYLHSNFIPRRNGSFDWRRPVDGSDPATDWGAPLPIDETPNVINPPNGWAFNTNDAPWMAAGPNSPRREDFPTYVENGGQNWRGVHATMLLEGRRDFTLEGLLEAAYDSYLPWFEEPMPALIRAWDGLPASDPMKSGLREQIALLRDWDLRWGADSVPTSLALFWGTEVQRQAGRGARGGGMSTEEYITSPEAAGVLLESLAAACDQLAADFGTWRTAWGEINRFQRLTGDIVQPFDDAKPSIPVGFTSSRWGSLASFGARAYPGTKKWYGTSGNSFVAVVEFGDRVRALAVTAGGESGDPASPHFNDQAERYATGNLREVYYYREQLRGHTERQYHPGG
ncbi:penicillin acylase family protein [Gemmatimonadota bacterium]